MRNIFTLLIGILTASLAGCGGGGGAQPAQPITPTLGVFSISEKTFGDADFLLLPPASNSSGAFSYSSSNPAVARVVGSSVTIVGAGTTTVTATQAAWAGFLSAMSSATLNVLPAKPVITGFLPVIKTYGDPSFALTTPVSNSGGAFTFTSDNPAVATVNSGVVSIVGAGTVQITATQAASGNFAASSATAALTVNAATPTLGAFVLGRQVFGVKPFLPSFPVSSSPGALSFSSSNGNVATIHPTSGLVTVVGAGASTITVTQAPTTNFLGSSTTATLNVDPATPSLGVFSALVKTWGDGPFVLTAPSSDSPGVFTFSIAQGQQQIASISGNTVTILAAPATVTITASQAATVNYSSSSISTTLSIQSNLPQGYTASGGVTRAPISTNRYSWSAANDYCISARFLGQSGWRLLGRSEIPLEGANFGDQIFVWLRDPGDNPGTHWFTGYSSIFPSGYRNGFVDDNLNSAYAVCVR